MRKKVSIRSYETVGPIRSNKIVELKGHMKE